MTVTDEIHMGTCPACGWQIRIVNWQPATRGLPEGGYLGRHWRPGLRVGYKCRGSFQAWVEQPADA